MGDFPDPPRIDALIRWAAAQFALSQTPMIDARALAKSAFALDDAMLIAEGDCVPSASATEFFASMVARRVQHEPVAHIVGRREFWSLDLVVAPGILVPRTDSETLIEAVVARRDPAEALRVIDLGCGSGALLCALLNEFPNATGVGVDLDERATETAAANLSRLGYAVRGKIVCGEWFGPVDGVFDVIISNPPYIPEGDRPSLPREVREYESATALFAGAEGLDAYRKIFAAAPRFLALGGLAVVEFGEGQASAVNDIARRAFPTANMEILADLSGRPRALVVDLRLASN